MWQQQNHFYVRIIIRKVYNGHARIRPVIIGNGTFHWRIEIQNICFKRRLFLRRAVGQCMLAACTHACIHDSKWYHNLLVLHAVPSDTQIIVWGFIIQQDKDTKHTANLCRKIVQSKQRQQVLQNIVWPSQSTRCNPIELLSDHLVRCIRDINITSRNYL